MEHSKIIEFYEEYQDKEFPFFETQNSISCHEIQKSIANKMDVNENIDLALFTKQLGEKLNFLSSEPIDFLNTKLSDLLLKIGIKSKTKNVYINWYNFDLIDKMRFDDLELFLLDLWYPQEDIEIISENYEWIISLNHDSMVRYHVMPKKFKL